MPILVRPNLLRVAASYNCAKLETKVDLLHFEQKYTITVDVILDFIFARES